MAIGRFIRQVKDDNIEYIVSKIIDDEIESIHQVCERYGLETDEVRYYDVYEVELTSGKKVLKKADKREVFNYETYLTSKELSVPYYYGKYVKQDSIWILTQYVNGEDLRNMTDELAIASAECLAQIQNEYWQQNENDFLQNKTDDRFEIYWKRVLKRALSVAENSKLRKAYQLFLDRQLVCPRTLSNGDFLQFNVMQEDGKVKIIDWGFGGIMPYSLDIARFIAHATKNRCTFPFYMTDEQKELFINSVYEKLYKKPEYSQYVQDIKLAVLNEYIEFVEADEDENKWYYNHAIQLADEILDEKSEKICYIL